jgi:PAS domain S-box-containing protein
VGRSFFEFLEGEDAEEARRQRELRLGGVGSRYEVNATAANGQEKVLLCGGYPLFGPDGAYEGAVQTVVDVTEERKAQEELRRSEELFRLTFEAAPVGLAHVAPDGRWLEINEPLCGISGYSRGELLGMTYRDVMHPNDLEAGLARLGRLLRGEVGPYSVEARYVRKDGQRVWARVWVSLVRGPSGEPERLVCAAEDVTERKLKEVLREPLTAREVEVLRLVALWCTDREIARKLGYSEGTIKTDVRHILRKFGVRGRRLAAGKAIEIGLIAPPQ